MAMWNFAYPQTGTPSHRLTVSPSHSLTLWPSRGFPPRPFLFPATAPSAARTLPTVQWDRGRGHHEKTPCFPPSRVYLVACPRMRCAGCSSPSVQPCAPYLLGEKPSTPITQALQCGTCSARDTCIILNFSLGHHALGGSVGSDSGV